MARVVQGDKLADFTYQTAYEQNLKISDTVKRVEGKTAIVFLRYFGCVLCQYNMREFIVNHGVISKTGGQLIVVLQSDPAVVREQTEGKELPYDIICDKDQELYKLFEIGSAASKMELFDDEGRAFIEKLKAEGFTHGAYEGNEQQLPALFIVDNDLNVEYAHYATLATDMPDSHEIAAMM